MRVPCTSALRRAACGGVGGNTGWWGRWCVGGGGSCACTTIHNKLPRQTHPSHFGTYTPPGALSRRSCPRRCTRSTRPTARSGASAAAPAVFPSSKIGSAPGRPVAAVFCCCIFCGCWLPTGKGNGRPVHPFQKADFFYPTIHIHIPRASARPRSPPARTSASPGTSCRGTGPAVVVCVCGGGGGRHETQFNETADETHEHTLKRTNRLIYCTP